MRRLCTGILLTALLIGPPIPGNAADKGAGAPAPGKNAVVEGVAGGVAGAGGTNEGGSLGVQADEFTGAATAVIPIPVPPGRGGIEPRLLLTYNSYRKNPNSWVGLGWELDLGAIARLPDEGNFDFVNGTSFEFRFGGQAETLVRVKQDVSPEVYGLVATPGVLVDEYTAKINTAFNIFLHLRNDTDPESVFDHGWVVIDKGGRRYTFGASEATREEIVSEATGFDQWVVRWLLESVVDPNGNTLTMNYGKDLLPAAIVYNDIQLLFAKSVDDAVHYYPLFRQSFLRREQVTRLRQIVINRVVNGQPTQLQKLTLEYAPGATNDVPLLTAVRQYGMTEQTSLPPITLQYHDGAISFGSEVKWGATNQVGGETNPGLLNDQTAFADMNGDGLVDQVSGFPLSDTLQVRLNSLAGLVDPITWTDPFKCPNPASGAIDKDYCAGSLTGFVGTEHQWLHFVDMNGDGLADRVGRSFKNNDYTSNEAYFIIAFNTGKGWTPTVATWKDPYVGPHPGTTDREKGLIDLNGDGLVDRVVGDKAQEGFRVYYNTGAGFKKSFVLWKDPIAVAAPNHPALAHLNDADGDRLYVAIRDINGDALPDRVYRQQLYIQQVDGSYQLTPGFHVSLNLNGRSWALPELGAPADCPAQVACTFFNTSDTLGIVDPVTDTAARGYLSDATHDLIDFNADGYLDRIEGDPGTGHLRIYFYAGLNPTATEEHFRVVPLILDDPVQDAPGEWPARGYVSKGNGKNLHTFFQDVNGDLYPDRVTVHPRNATASTKQYHIAPLAVNALTFSTSPVTWPHPVNQPLGALQQIDNGRGLTTATEYLPTSWPWDWPTPTHRFLPTPMYVAHKVYSSDTGITGPVAATPEAQRHPHMRWTTIKYWGGNRFVRFAHKTQNDPEDDAIDAPFVVRFHGFQQVDRYREPLPGETWTPYATTSFYHQGKGEAPLEATPPVAVDPGGYTAFALTGRRYRSQLKEGNLFRTDTVTTWIANSLPQDQLYTVIDCTTPDCIPQRTIESTTIREPGNPTPRTQTTAYEYDAVGNVTAEVRLANGTTLLEVATTYAPAGDFALLLHLRDRPTSTTWHLGGVTYRKMTFGYDALGNPTQETHWVDAGGAKTETITRTFNPVGNMATVTGTDGVKRTITYDGDQLFPTKTSVTLPNGTLTTKRQFNRLNAQPTLELSPQEVGQQTTYDDFGRVAAEWIVATDGSAALLRKYQYTYVTAAVESAEAVTLHKTEAWEPELGFPDTYEIPALITYTDGRGGVLQECRRSERGDYRLTQRRRFAGGRREIVTQPSFASTCDFLQVLKGNIAYATTINADLFGRPLQLTPPAGEPGSPSEMTSILYANTFDGRATRHSTLPKGQKRAEVFDGLGRLDEVHEEANTTAEYTYNPVGDLLTVVVNGKTLSTSTYDLLGRATAVTDADMGTSSYLYDPFGRITTQTDNKQQKTAFTYDAIGRLTSRKYIGAQGVEKTESYQYDAPIAGYNVVAGELAQVTETDGAGQTLRISRFGYDPTYRRVAKMSRWIPDVGEFPQTFTHDPKGKLTSTIYPGNTPLYYQYNAIGGPWRICAALSCDAATSEVYYTIDPATGFDTHGAPLQEAFGNGVTTTYQYYASNHRQRIATTGLGDQLYSQRVYSYDGASNVAAIADPLSAVGTGAIKQTSYDALNRLTSVTPAGGPNLAMTYDADGNLLTQSPNYAGQTYEYGGPRPHAVTKLGTEVFTYDANGNMATDGDRTLTYDAANHLVGVMMKDGTVAAYAYDYTGARVFKKVTTQDASGKVVEHTTHYLGEAVEIHLPTGDVGTVDQVVLHVFAGTQRIASRNMGSLATVLGAPAGTLTDSGGDGAGPASGRLGLALLGLLGGLITVLLRHRRRIPWGAAQPVMARRARAAALPRAALASRGLACLLIATLLVPPGATIAGDTGLPLPGTSATPWRYYYHADHLGSLQLVTEGMPLGYHAGLTFPRGTVVQRFEYTAWGQDRFAVNPNLPVDPRYTGQPYDIETGLYYYKARYYNPVLARFVQPDPVVSDPTDPQAWNRYAYVRNNPLTYTDPTGYEPLLTDEDLALVMDLPPGYFSEGAGPGAAWNNVGTIGLYANPAAAHDPRHEGDAPADSGGLVGTTTGTNGNTNLGVLTYVVALQVYATNNPFAPALGYLQTAGAAALTAAGTASDWVGTTVGCDALCQVALGALLQPELTAASVAASTLGEIGVVGLLGRAGQFNRGPEKLYHYGFSKSVESILTEGLKAGPSGKIFLTPAGHLSPMQAQIELALSPNQGLRNAVFEIDVAKLRQLGIEVPAATRVRSWFNIPGGGYETIIDVPKIPAEAIKRIR